MLKPAALIRTLVPPLVVLLSVALLLGVCRTDGPSLSLDDLPALTPSESASASTLAVRYAPVYLVPAQPAPCSRLGDPFDPAPVEVVLGGDLAVRLVTSEKTIYGPMVEDLREAGASAFLDIPGRADRPGCGYEQTNRRLFEGHRPTVYARIAREEGSEGFALQFWSYWLFNDWNNRHEGDWEMVQLVFEADSLGEGLTIGPSFAAYSQHGSGERRDWDDPKLSQLGDRPVVFVSRGSHASYFSAGTYVGLGEDGAGLGCDHATGAFRLVDPVVQEVPTNPTDHPEFAWLEFRGRWGERGPGEFDGAKGPVTKRAWREPISWAADLREGSTVLPRADSLGRNAVADVCAAIATGSRLVLPLLERPLLVAIGTGVTVVLLAYTGTVIARDSLRDSYVGWHQPGFLRHQRRMGQIVRAALVLYVQHPRTFLGIALAFAPVQVAVSLLGTSLLNLPLLEQIVWLFNASDAAKYLIALLAGGFSSLVVYLFVVSASIAATLQLDRGMPATASVAYRSVLSRLPHLTLGRARTLVAIALFSLSVVGVPVAIWLTVRWFFVEEAVIIDRRSFWTAPGASSRAVERSWSRAAVLILFFVGTAALAGTLSAALLLFVTPLPLWAVNVLAGLAQLAALPFMTLGLSLTYSDLTTRALAHEAAATRNPRDTPFSGGVRRFLSGLLHAFEGRRR